MKTAMQEMIGLLYNEPIDNINGHYLIIKAKELLEKEKQQIIDAFCNGSAVGKELSSIEYYSETFNNND